MHLIVSEKELETIMGALYCCEEEHLKVLTSDTARDEPEEVLIDSRTEVRIINRLKDRFLN